MLTPVADFQCLHWQTALRSGGILPNEKRITILLLYSYDLLSPQQVITAALIDLPDVFQEKPGVFLTPLEDV